MANLLVSSYIAEAGPASVPPELKYFALFCFAVMVWLVLLLIFTSRENSYKKRQEDPEKSFRIVELESGRFSVQEWQWWNEDWGIPMEKIGPYTFDTLREAEARKAKLVEASKSRLGLRIKRVVG